MRICKSVLFIFFMLYSIGSRAENFLCNAGVVTIGETKTSVMRKCGSPESMQDYAYAWRSFGGIEQWYYQRDRGQFPRILTFEGYILKDIKTVTTGMR